MIHVSRTQIARALTETMSLKRGNGLVEAIFSALLLLLALVAMFFETNTIPTWLSGAIGVMVGYYFRDKISEHGGIQ